MGFLTFWKKEEVKEKDLFKAIVIKRLLEDVEDLRSKYNKLEDEFNILKSSKEKKSNEFKFTKLEKRIIETYNKSKPKTLKEFAKLIKIKETSLRVYVSRLKTRNINIEFD